MSALADHGGIITAGQKKPRQWRGHTGFCCCRESGLGACVSLWWLLFLLFSAASTSNCWFVLLLVGFFWLRCLVTDVELSSAQHRDLFCAHHLSASPVPGRKNCFYYRPVPGTGGLTSDVTLVDRKKNRLLSVPADLAKTSAGSGEIEHWRDPTRPTVRIGRQRTPVNPP